MNQCTSCHLHPGAGLAYILVHFYNKYPKKIELSIHNHNAHVAAFFPLPNEIQDRRKFKMK